MSTSDEKDGVKGGFEAFHLDRNALLTLSAGVRASATVVTIIALFPLAACALISLFLLVRLGWDALTLSGTTYQESARNFLIAFAGVFGAPFLVWRAWVAHQQATAAVNQARVALENHITGIFTKSVELLGVVRDMKVVAADGTSTVRSIPNLESRLGALYSLERLLSESEKDQRAILETLCAYIRENSPLEPVQDEKLQQELSRGDVAPSPSRRSDVQAAITIIGRRPDKVRLRAEIEGWRLDLRNSNLVGYDFSNSNFDRSDFTDSYLNFAKLNQASFINSVFLNSTLCSTQMSGACFQRSHFKNCNVKKAVIHDSDFRQTRIEKTDLREATVTSFNIAGANLEDAIGSYLEYAVEDAKTNGAKHYLTANEIVRTVELFRKAAYDDQTKVSQAVHDAIRLMTTDAAPAPGAEPPSS